VRPDTVSSSLVTGVLGIQPHPTVGEVLGWLLFAIPMLVYVLLPRRTGAGADRVTDARYERA
jgi:high-affinity iron transporter